MVSAVVMLNNVGVAMVSSDYRLEFRLINA